MKRLLLAALLMISISSFVFGQEPTPVLRSIEANNQRFVAAFNQGDAALIASMYTPDAVLLPSNSPIIGNQLGIRTYWQNAINAGVKMVSLKTSSVEECGNTAYEVGQFTLTIPKAGGGKITDYGKYIVVWKRQGRRWKLAVDSFSTNLPASGQ